MIKKYRKKPLIIEAIQWTGDNLIEITAFLRKIPTEEITSEINSSELAQKNWKEHEKVLYHKGITIATLEGDMTASVGDYIIKGVEGEFYPCKEKIFNETYELI